MDTGGRAIVRITLLLQGGFEVGLDLAPDSPELREITAALARTGGQRSARLLQLDTGGDEVLTVPTDHIVAMRTRGGDVAVAPKDPLAPYPSTVTALRFVGGVPVVLTRSRSHYPSPALVADHFLPLDQNARLLQFAVAHEGEFMQSSTTSGVKDYRASRVLFEFPPFDTLIRDRIAAVLPDVLRRFGVREFQPEQVEAQLTAHNDGNFYKVHTDRGSDRTSGRVLTYVYYFCREPRQFSGGGLRIYDAVRRRDGSWAQGKSSYEIAPENNCIVFFPSRYHHEVLPVECPSRRFEDGRFTINGWIHRASSPLRPRTGRRR